MNPFMNALSRMGSNPMANMQQLMNRIGQIQNTFRNPQALVQQFFSDVPQDMQGDPDKIVKYLIQNGRITQEQVDQISRMFPHK